jgi:hypothetical protein
MLVALAGADLGADGLLKYQLVLQWQLSPTATYDALIEVEDLLIDGLAGVGDVDAHDLGFGEMNIFIWTDDAIEAFARTQTAAGQHALS